MAYLTRRIDAEAKNARCLPIEVKAGTSGKMKSLRLFMNRKGLASGIRSSLDNFGVLEVEDNDDRGRAVSRSIGILPLYAVWRLPDLPLPLQTFVRIHRCPELLIFYRIMVARNLQKLSRFRATINLYHSIFAAYD